MHDRPCLVVLSGGQDSTTCLYWAKANFARVHAVTFRYGQRHKREISQAVQIGRHAEVETHRVLDLDIFEQLSGNALVNHDQAIEEGPAGLPTTFVPGRNVMFLTAAAAHAYNLGVPELVTGVCETDFSGYPDCRRDTIRALEMTLKFGLDWTPLKIYTPLMDWDKRKTVLYMWEQGPAAWEALGMTHTCYEGKHPPCGECPACQLRAKGFSEAGLTDPILEETSNADSGDDHAPDDG